MKKTLLSFLFSLLILIALMPSKALAAEADRSLQQALDRVTSGSNVTEFNLSQFDSNISDTLFIRGGINVRFVNGTLKRVENRNPLIVIKDNSSLEIGKDAIIRGEGSIPIIIVSGGNLTVSGGHIDGTVYSQEERAGGASRRKTKSDTRTSGAIYSPLAPSPTVELTSLSESSLSVKSGILTGAVRNYGNNRVHFLGGTISSVETSDEDILVGDSAKIGNVQLNGNSRVGIVSQITNDLPIKGVTAGKAAVYGAGYTLTYSDAAHVWFKDDYDVKLSNNTVIAAEWGTVRVVWGEAGHLACMSNANQEKTERLIFTNKVNGDDIRMIRNIGTKALKEIEFSHASIVSGGGVYYSRDITPAGYHGVFTYQVFYTENDTISYHMFGDLTTLESITLPSSLRVIEDEAFINCKNLKEIGGFYNVREIGGSAFNGCTSLTNCNFSYCDYLTSENGVIYDKEMTKIHAALPAVVSGDYIIPSTIEEINSNAFLGCTSLTSVDMEKSNITTLNSSVFKSCSTLKNIKLPKMLREIGADAFSNCSLTSVTFPESLIEIGAGAFSYNPIKEIHCLSSVPPAIQKFSPHAIYIGSSPPPAGSFQSVDTLTCKVYVPKGSIEAYKSAPGWSSFQNYVEESPIPEQISTVDDLQARLDDIAERKKNHKPYYEVLVLADAGVLVDKPLYVRNGCEAYLSGGPLKLSPNAQGDYPLIIDGESKLIMYNDLDMMNDDFRYHTGIMKNSGYVYYTGKFYNVPSNEGQHGKHLFYCTSGSEFYLYTNSPISTSGVSVFQADSEAFVHIMHGEIESCYVPTIGGNGKIGATNSIINGGGKGVSIVKAEFFSIGNDGGLSFMTDTQGGSTYITADEINLSAMIKGNGKDVVVGKHIWTDGLPATIFLKKNAYASLYGSHATFDGEWADFTLEKTVVEGVKTQEDYETLTFLNMPADREPYYDERKQTVVLRQKEESDIRGIIADESEIVDAYDMLGRKMENDTYRRGLQLQRMSDGTVKKIMKR